ncbi:DUF3667 domain-containing protein [Flavobacterium sp. ZT3R18]|uniref:DUF3667 domain-containing protein n=1 Tax=Flavobacterium sp. ZT3R18 TaxID=2594429 RepID=UPI00117B0A0A|nr:DUF3667 domain-containing protein [Flavobacterium sp. ZT3R18]TRX38678.1 DUF3667 domain-containing protein [Flavobacterium sp. ZT3R18]
MNNCSNCNDALTGKYCSNCGQPAKVKRIDGHYIVHEIEHILHFERGILFTIKELLIRPGQNISHFIAENRSRLVKPVIFIIVTSLIFTLISHFFHIEDGYIHIDGAKKTAIGSVFNWIQNHYGYANIIMGMFIAFWLKIFFRKYDYNFFELVILLCFVMGMGMLMYAVFTLLVGLTKLNLMPIAGFVGFAYCTWAIGQFFDKTKPISYVKAFASYVLGMLTFSFSAVILGTLIDLIIKH